MVIHTSFKDSKPSSLTKEFYLCFAYISLCKTCDPMAGPILIQVTFNNLGRGLLDGKYPVFLHIKVLINANVKLQLLGPGHFSNKVKISINVVEVYWQMPYTK